MPLTATSIKNANPKDKSYRLFDSGGMYLEVSPKGGKWWRLKYRFNGKEKRLSLGVYPTVTLIIAREKCTDAKRLLSEGIDPSEYRKANKARNIEQCSNRFHYQYIDIKPFIFRAGSPPAQLFSTFHTAWAIPLADAQVIINE